MMKYSIGMLIVGTVMMTHTPAMCVADQAEDTAAIEQAAESYACAFNARDAEALAAHWAPEAVYINPLSGTQVEGREAIAKELEAIFEELQEATLTVDIEAIQFISPSVAVEHGLAKLSSAGEPLDESNYTAVHVKRDGKWLLDRVTEKDAPRAPSPHEKLGELEWLLGTWTDEEDDARIETTCQWSRNKSFLVRSFTVTVQNRIDMTGMQLIGWDPVSKEIRSWVFDSDGGFAVGRWSKNGKRWSITTLGTLPDGRSASSVNVITYVNDDEFTWHSVNRTADGEVLPNIDEVVIVRAQ